LHNIIHRLQQDNAALEDVNAQLEEEVEHREQDIEFLQDEARKELRAVHQRVEAALANF